MNSQTPPLRVYSGARAWDIVWKWKWFAREQWQPGFRKAKEGTRRAMASLLPKLDVKSVLDCSCGLGWKTILLKEMGYDVEGCDGSAFAVKHASELASDEGHDIRFFRSRWERLGETCGRRYDCVYCDAFAWITTRRSLRASARGVYSVLKRGGTFVFQGAHQWSRESDRQRLIDEEYKAEGPFEALPTYEKDGVRLVTLIAREKKQDGILGNRIHIIDDNGTVRIEIASIPDLCKWTWADYRETLSGAGFCDVYSVKERGVRPGPYYLNVAVK